MHVVTGLLVDIPWDWSVSLHYGRHRLALHLEAAGAVVLRHEAQRVRALRLEVERDLLPREARINSTLTTLMTDCWEHKPTERPDFLAIRRRLKYHYADALDQKL